MVYFSNKKKVNSIIETLIIPSLKTKDLDYYQTIQAISKETGVTANIVEEIIKTYSAEIEEVRILTLPKNKIVDFLTELRQQENKIKEEIKEAGL